MRVLELVEGGGLESWGRATNGPRVVKIASPQTFPFHLIFRRKPHNFHHSFICAKTPHATQYCIRFSVSTIPSIGLFDTIIRYYPLEAAALRGATAVFEYTTIQGRLWPELWSSASDCSLNCGTSWSTTRPSRFKLWYIQKIAFRHEFM